MPYNYEPSEQVILLSEEESDDLMIDIVYAKCYCRKCGKTYGVSIYRNKVSRNRIRCIDCWKAETENDALAERREILETLHN